MPAGGLATDTRAPSDGIDSPTNVARDWDWELTVAEAQKGYVRGTEGASARAGLRGSEGAPRRRSREG